MGAPRITDDELAQIAKLFHAGVSATAAAKQLKRSSAIVAQRYRNLKKTKGGNGGDGVALFSKPHPNASWTENEAPVTITASRLQKQVDELMAANRSLTLRNHSLLRALKIIRDLSDVEVPF